MREITYFIYISTYLDYLILGVDNMYIMKFIYLHLFCYSDDKIIRLTQSDFDARCPRCARYSRH